MARLTQEEIQQGLKNLPGWSGTVEGISRVMPFPSFPDAVAFVTRLAFQAEAADHHPDILISYKRVTLTFSTHSEGGVTRKDLEGATAANRLFEGR